MRNYVHITQPVERLQPDERSQLCRHVIMCDQTESITPNDDHVDERHSHIKHLILPGLICHDGFTLIHSLTLLNISSILPVPDFAARRIYASAVLMILILSV